MTCVLVIDGDSSARTAIQTLLEMEGFEVVTADGDDRGIRAIETSLFDAVIVDVVVPRVEALDAIKVLRGFAPIVPIIAIAPRKFRDCLGPERDFLGMAMTFGAACGLYKPFMPRELITAVVDCIGRQNSDQAGNSAAASDRSSRSNNPSAE
jgi:two-component system OmpR family response regulator